MLAFAVRLYRIFDNQARSAASDLGPLDVREITNDPFVAAKLAGSRPFVIEVPLAYCRNRRGFPYSQDGPHPFVRTTRAYAEGRAACYEGSPLERYYAHYQPQNAAESLGLHGDPSPALLAAPPYGVVVPWERRPLAEGHERCARIAKNESRTHGANLSLEHGTSGVGPVSKEKGALEFSRLAKLADSIRAKGYIRSEMRDGDISARPLLWCGRGVRYVLYGGKHRAAVLAALGFNLIPIRVRMGNLPRSDEIEQWPHVKDGLFSCDQARELFRRIWEGQPPPSAVPPEWQA